MRHSPVIALTAVLLLVPLTALSSDIDNGLDSDLPEKSQSKISDRLLQSLIPPGMAALTDQDPIRMVKVGSTATADELNHLVSTLNGAISLSAGTDHWIDLPESRIDDLAGMDHVTYVALPEQPYALGDVSEGVSTMEMSTWVDSGLTGQGQSVAIVDLGFSGYQSAIASGDLPADLVVQNYCSSFQGTPHGTGVAEIVHDVAPDARIYLVCVDSVPDLANSVDYALAQSIDVINHSVGWFNSSRGDGSGGAGTPDGIAGHAVDSGIVWVNASGNHARRHWSGTFEDDDEDGLLDYEPGSEANTFVLQPFQQATVFLKWDSWPLTNIDYDLYLYDLDTETFVVGSTGSQNGTQPPVEALDYANLTGSPMNLGVVISEFANPGASSPRLDVFTLGHDLTYNVPAGSIVEPSGHPDVIAVGATCWSDDQLASYSSRGPSISGTPKPDISAPTGVSTFAYGTGNQTCSSGFTGTSSASPHVAGAAALVLDGDSSLTPAAVLARLEANTIDLGPEGFDNSYGAGRVRAHGLCHGEVGSILGSGGDDELVGTSKRDVILGFGGDDTIFGGSGPDLICGGKGSDVVRGQKGDDEMRGGAGDDELKGGGGDDQYIGGDGVDTASFGGANASVDVRLKQGRATGQGNDTLTSIANIIGSPYADTLIGNEEPNVIRGGRGKDTIFGLGGSDTLSGGKAADVLDGGSGSDFLMGKTGGDLLLGQKGWDTLLGGGGDDEIRGGPGSDEASYQDAGGPVSVNLKEGWASGSRGNDLLIDLERIVGSDYGDLLIGNGAENVIKGGAGDDDLRGRAGDDTLNGQAGFDSANGGSGQDACVNVETTVSCE